MVVKRGLSYFIDMAIILVFVLFFNVLIPNKYDKEFSILNQNYLEQNIKQEEYMEKYKELIHISDKEDIIKNISTTILLIVFFILVPYCTNGQTIGQKIMKLKIVSDKKIDVEQLAGRSVIINGLGYMIFMLLILYITNDNIYFILINLFGFFQIIIVIISVFMILYRQDKLSLADKFTNTRIEEI